MELDARDAIIRPAVSAAVTPQHLTARDCPGDSHPCGTAERAAAALPSFAHTCGRADS